MTSKIDQTTVDTAAREAAEAAEAVAKLEAEIISGTTTVTLADLEAQERVSRQRRLDLEAAKTRFAQATEAARQAEISKLRKDIDAHKPDDLVALLRAVESSAAAFHEAVNARNIRVYAWRDRLIQLGVDRITSAEVDESGDLAPTEAWPYGIWLDKKLVMPIDRPQEYVEEAIARAREPRVRDIYSELVANSGQ